MKLISVVSTCYNEEDNIQDIYQQVRNIFEDSELYSYEHIFSDNASVDGTVSILKKIAERDRNVKVIVNNRNFGTDRSACNAMCQARGDAVVLIAADLQDPPSMISNFLEKWEEGFKVVIGIKAESDENPIIYFIRKLYYLLISKYSETEQVMNFTGFGLYDKKVIEVLRSLDETDPYFRGLITETGYERAEIEFRQEKRRKGESKSNFYTLYDMAMLGITSHSKVPLRMAVFIGLTIGFISFVVAIAYLIYKLVFWERFQLGLAPLVISVFFFAAIQLFFIGIIGEYLGAIYTQVKQRPWVIEKERINFHEEDI